jgi:hypothetical protein
MMSVAMMFVRLGFELKLLVVERSTLGLQLQLRVETLWSGVRRLEVRLASSAATFSLSLRA